MSTEKQVIGVGMWNMWEYEPEFPRFAIFLKRFSFEVVTTMEIIRAFTSLDFDEASPKVRKAATLFDNERGTDIEGWIWETWPLWLCCRQPGGYFCERGHWDDYKERLSLLRELGVYEPSFDANLGARLKLH